MALNTAFLCKSNAMPFFLDLYKEVWVRLLTAQPPPRSSSSATFGPALRTVGPWQTKKFGNLARWLRFSDLIPAVTSAPATGSPICGRTSTASGPSRLIIILFRRSSIAGFHDNCNFYSELCGFIRSVACEHCEFAGACKHPDNTNVCQPLPQLWQRCLMLQRS